MRALAAAAAEPAESSAASSAWDEHWQPVFEDAIHGKISWDVTLMLAEKLRSTEVRKIQPGFVGALERQKRYRMLQKRYRAALKVQARGYDVTLVENLRGTGAHKVQPGFVRALERQKARSRAVLKGQARDRSAPTPTEETK